MNKCNKWIMLAVVLLGGMACLRAEPSQAYMELDRNIVKAYNSRPRDTGSVYRNSMLILNKAETDEASTAVPWKLKAQKLITVACFYECTQAIDKKLYRQAYVWAKRGEKNGTDFGKIGETPVQKLYEYLTFAGKELQETPMVKNSNPDELSKQIENYQDQTRIEKRLHSLSAMGRELRSKLDADVFLLAATAK